MLFRISVYFKYVTISMFFRLKADIYILKFLKEHSHTCCLKYIGIKFNFRIGGILGCTSFHSYSKIKK